MPCYALIKSTVTNSYYYIMSRCAPFFPLQQCGNVCGIIVSILAVSISIDANLFFSFCKNKSIFAAHQWPYLQNVSRYNCYLRVVQVKWRLSNQFKIKYIIYQAYKTKLSDMKNFCTNNSVKPYLENNNYSTTSNSNFNNSNNSSNIRTEFKQRRCTSKPIV